MTPELFGEQNDLAEVIIAPGKPVIKGCGSAEN